MAEFEVGRRRPLRRNMEAAPIAPSKPVKMQDKDSDNNFQNLNRQKTTPKHNRKRGSGISPASNPYKVLPLIEIDLHIHELLDSTVGMDNFAMLTYQLDTVRKIMKSHSRRVGQKIVFIHGKGDGVLRKEVRKLLAKEYASCDVQDASFLKYGFGATEVTVRQSPV